MPRHIFIDARSVTGECKTFDRIPSTAPTGRGKCQAEEARDGIEPGQSDASRYPLKKKIKACPSNAAAQLCRGAIWSQATAWLPAW